MAAECVFFHLAVFFSIGIRRGEGDYNPPPTGGCQSDVGGLYIYIIYIWSAAAIIVKLPPDLPSIYYHKGTWLVLAHSGSKWLNFQIFFIAIIAVLPPDLPNIEYHKGDRLVSAHFGSTFNRFKRF